MILGKLYLYLLLGIITLNSCSEYRIKIDNDIDKIGVDIWGKDVNYVFMGEDVDIILSDVIPFGHNPGGWYYKNEKEIRIKVNHENVVAHEFGHFLGYEHSTNPNSIMYPVMNTNRDLKIFIEFRGK